MRCSDLEALICDYVEGALTAAEKATVELHLSSCASCRAMVEDARAALAFIERAAEVEPPPALVNHLLFEVRQGAARPVRERRGWLGRLIEPVLHPRFAMGMAMTILSFAMLARFAGVPVRQLKVSDLEPARVWMALEDRAWRTWDRAKKYYESLRLVYEIQQTLKEWTEEPAAPAAATPPKERPAGAGADSRKAGEGIDWSLPPQVESPRDGRKKK
ncbi:MAG: zf-HC2 domain-containing protein [Bryobacteraceae bacterium]|nr:zf-HC2 domain-containing protein [Bryobacteraceae bacterium]